STRGVRNMKRYRSWIVCALLMASSAGCGVEPGVSAETSEVEQVVAITVPSLSARCTGVVIGERRVMTAAHCLVDGSRLFDPSDLRVVLARDLALVDEDQTLSVERISAHPDYVGGDEHDVAWIETHEPIGVEPVELTTSFEDLPVGFAPDTVSAMLAGYTTAQTVEPNAEAGMLDIFEGELQVRDDTTFQFRAGGEAERTVCLGDSGAPVFAPSEDAGGANHLLGMVSHAVRHCTSGATVAQRVDRYRAFLLDAEISTPAVAMAQPMALSAAEATPDWPFGLRIALRSRRTGKYVSAHPDTWRPPASIADGPAVWEQFDVRQIEGAYVALRAVSSGQYLMTMADGLLTTEGTQPALWEQFVWVRHPNGSIGLQSRRTGKYVVDRVDDLAAISPQHGAWEQFDWEVVPRVSEPEHRVIPISSANPAWSALGVRRFVVSPQYPVTSGTFASLSYAVVAQGDGHVPLYFMSYEQRIDQLAAMGQTLNNPANVDVAAYFGAMFHRLKILTVSSSGEPSADDQGQLIAGLTLGVAPGCVPLARRYR
ncbi:MAG: S1 family peptidase, partial [Myxococcota bacterium]